jgi:hypothetical protein
MALPEGENTSTRKSSLSHTHDIHHGSPRGWKEGLSPQISKEKCIKKGLHLKSLSKRNALKRITDTKTPS